MSEPTFTGSESPADIARIAIKWFAEKPHDAEFTIFYENSIPMMRYRFESDWVEFDCVYRLDILLESFYSDAERIFDQNANANFIEAELRPLMVPVIAFAGMTAILGRLLILQGRLFLDMLDEIRVTTAGMFLHSLVVQSPHKSSLGRGASKVIQDWIDEVVDAAMKKKREFLVGYMNLHPLINIPTTVGRPEGTKKPEKQKQRESEAFAKELEDAIRRLYVQDGKMPKKIRVAAELGIGGDESRSSAFYNKLKRTGVDYDAIAAKVKLHG